MAKGKRNGLTFTECSVKICRSLPFSPPCWKWTYHNATQSECAHHLISTRTHTQPWRVFQLNLSSQQSHETGCRYLTRSLHAFHCQFPSLSPCFSVQSPLCISLEGLLNRRKYFELPLRRRSNGSLSAVIKEKLNFLCWWYINFLFAYQF